jgi:glucose-6-phosphate dehydrogenase assembly protein OpcA
MRALGGKQVALRDVDTELNRALKLIQGADEAPLQRARIANLVVFTNSEEAACQIDAQLPEIVAVHPARVLLLLAEPGGGGDMTARVSVRPVQVGFERLIFCEQVTLRAGAHQDRLPFSVRALLVGDLPTNLWWAAPVPPPLAGPLLYELCEPCQVVMYDSLGWTDPTRGMAATANWLEQIERTDPCGRWRVASDVNWRRLKYWRRLTMQALGAASAPGAAETVSEIYVEHGPHAVIQAWELASWLTVRLGWTVRGGKIQPGQELTWRCAGPKGEARVRVHRLEAGPPEVRRLRLVCQIDGKPTALNLSIEGEQRLSITLEGLDVAPRTIALPAHSPAEVIGRQLSDRERDPVFRESMAVAQVMAQSVLQ